MFLSGWTGQLISASHLSSYCIKAGHTWEHYWANLHKICPFCKLLGGIVQFDWNQWSANMILICEITDPIFNTPIDFCPITSSVFFLFFMFNPPSAQVVPCCVGIRDCWQPSRAQFAAKWSAASWVWLFASVVILIGITGSWDYRARCKRTYQESAG